MQQDEDSEMTRAEASWSSGENLKAVLSVYSGMSNGQSRKARGKGGRI